MAIAYGSQGAGGGTESNGASLDLVCPATVNANDILIAHVTFEGLTNAPTEPADWDLLYGPANLGTGTAVARSWVYGKIAVGDEDGDTIGFGSHANTSGRYGRIYSFTGWVSGTIDEVCVGFSDIPTETSIPLPTVTTSLAGGLAVALLVQDDNNAFADASGESGGSWTEPVAEFVSNTLGAQGCCVGIQTCTPTADPGTVTGGTANATADEGSSIGFAIHTDPIPGPARTNVHSQASSEPHGTGDFTTSSFTPPSNSLLVVCVAGMRVSTATDITSSYTVSGGGWTYTPQVGIGSSTSVFSITQRIFTAPVTTGASMTLTVSTGGVNMQFYAVSVVAYTGYNTGSPIGATGTLLVEDSGAPDGAQSFSLSGAPAADSEVVAAITLDKDAVGTTPGADFTEIHDVQAGGAGGIQSQIRLGSTSTTVAWVDTNTGGNIFKVVGAAVEIKNAAGGATVEGTAAGAFTFSGTASGVPETFGAAAAPFAFTGTASGQPFVSGQAAAAFVFTGAANGTVGAPAVTGAAEGAFAFTGTAAGTPETFGTAAASLAFTGTASGTSRTLGAATAALTLTGTAAGTPETFGQAAGAFTFTGTAAGTRRVLGQAAGSFAFTGAANGFAGTPPVQGQAQAAFAFTGTASGQSTVLGQAGAAFGLTATAQGLVRVPGQASGTFTFTGTAAGDRTVRGIAVGEFAFLGSAHGEGATFNAQSVLSVTAGRTSIASVTAGRISVAFLTARRTSQVFVTARRTSEAVVGASASSSSSVTD